MRFKPRSSIKVLFGFVAIVAVVYGGWNLYAESQLRQFQFKAIAPSRVSLIAVNTGAGYRITVSNSTAQLVAGGNGEFGAPDARDDDDGSGTNKLRIPLRDMLLAMQGDPKATSKLVMSMNRMSADDLPPNPVIWTKEQLEKAINGDAELQKKLESDLNVTLKGMPLSVARESSLEDGIVVEVPVPVTVKVGSEVRTIEARIREPYRPGFAQRVHDRYKMSPNITTDLITANYIVEAKRIQSKEVKPEDVAQILQDRWSVARLKQIAEKPERILQNTEVVLTENQLTGAKWQQRKDSNNRPMFDLTIGLTEEGRMRLWKYSREHPGFQLLFTVDGVAVAAPRIRRETVTGEVTVTQLTDERLTKKSADVINQLVKKGTSKQ